MNLQGWPPEPARRPPGGTPCVGRASPFGPHPRKEKRDFLGGPVVKTVLPQQGPWVPSPVVEHPTCPLAWPKKKKERGSSDTCYPPRHLFSLSLSLPILFISFPTKCSHPPRTYPTPHFSKHKPNPFPPPWIPRGSSQHRRCLLGKYSASLFLVCNSACMHARSLIWGVHVILSTPIDISGSLKEGPFVTQVVNILLKMLS